MDPLAVLRSLTGTGLFFSGRKTSDVNFFQALQGFNHSAI
jgi:hypothetical protein